MSGHAVLLGAGHAHLLTLLRAGAFTARGHRLTVVAPDRFWYSGLATAMLGGEVAPECDQVDVAALAARGGGRFVRDLVTRVDPAARLVHLEHGPPLAYDALSLNLGSETPAIPGEGEACHYAVKPIRRVWDLRTELERRFRDAPRATVRIVLAGGGVTGCELAGNLAALAARRGGSAEITVLAAGEGVLDSVPAAAARRVVDALCRRGVVVRTAARVARLDGGRAMLGDGDAVPFDLFVNATGLGPGRVIRRCGLPVDEAGALRVDGHLRSIADPAVHGGGDCVSVEAHGLPRVGVYAIRQAPILCHNLLASLEGWAPRRFRPQRRYLWIMNLGDGSGLAVRGALWWHGRASHWLKDRIDRRFLCRYQRAAAG